MTDQQHARFAREVERLRNLMRLKREQESRRAALDSVSFLLRKQGE